MKNAPNLKEISNEGEYPSQASMENAIQDMEDLILPWFSSEREMNFNETRMALEKLKNTHGINLTKIKRILLTTNGSVTRILQSIQRKSTYQVRVHTINQILTRYPGRGNDFTIQERLGIEPRMEYNFRKVLLTTRKHRYILAISLTPVCMLSPEFRDDLMRADVPIGILLDKYKLEMLRRITVIGAAYPTAEMQKVFKIGEQRKIPFRSYEIIHEKKLLMKIYEFLNPNL